MIDLLYDDVMIGHDPGPDHPERPERLAALRDALRPRLAAAAVTWRRPEAASRDAVERVHSARLLDTLEEVRGQRVRLDADTTMSPSSLDAAYMAAGAAIDAARVVVSGEAQSAVALVRPPGHHAEASRPMGFCLFNNVAIAAAYAVAEWGLERVLVVDWDVHHGNGTQHSFEDRRDVLFASSHRYPFYPGTGAAHEQGRGAGIGYTVNLPLPEAMTDGDYALMFESIVAPIAQAYDPDLVLVSAGYDAHRLDPIGGMDVSDEGFATLCATLQAVARECCGGKVALVLEGGYSLEGLVESVGACIDILQGATPPERPQATHRGESLAGTLRDLHRRHWSIL